MGFFIKVVVTAVALWITTFLVSGVRVHPYANDTVATVLTYLLIAAVFGVINAVIGTALQGTSFSVYAIVYGVAALVLNVILLLGIAWISTQIGWGLVVDGIWWAVLGAVVLSYFSWLVGLIVRPRRLRVV